MTNLPAFNVKLTNEQLGHMWAWIETQGTDSIANALRFQWWPADFDTAGEVRSASARNGRTCVGPAYKGAYKFTGLELMTRLSKAGKTTVEQWNKLLLESMPGRHLHEYG